MSKIAVIYARYSSDRQREESIEGQIRECKAYAKKNGITVIRVYCDRAMTGKTDKRPEFQAMIKDAKKQDFDYVLVYKLNRFARSRYDSARYKNVLKQHGIRVISAMENIAEDSSGILLESVIEGLAEYYSAELAENVLRGMTENALECKWPGGIVPLGFKLNKDKHLVIDDDKAFIVREIFQSIIDGKRTSTIIDELNARHLKTAAGKSFRKNSLEKILKNERYTGTFVWKDIRKENAIPAIITNDMFNAVQKILKNRKKTRSRVCSDNYLISGRLFCGLCHEKMIGMSGRSVTGLPYYYYACSNRRNRIGKCHTKNIRADKLEELVVDTTINILSNDTAIEYIAKQAIAAQEENRAQSSIPAIKEEIKELSKKLKNCVQAVENGIISQTIAENIPMYEKRLVELNSELSDELEKDNDLKVDEDMIRFFFERLVQRTKKETKFKSLLLSTMVRCVVVYDDYIEIQYNYKKELPILTNPVRINSSILFAVVECSDLQSNFIFYPEGFSYIVRRVA